MHKSDLVKAVATSANMSGPAAEKAVNAVFDSIKDSLKQGDKVTLTGFGTFEVASQAAREGRNPKTNSKIQIAARKRVRFRLGSDLDAIR
ncbi:MAG: HU family DNA-binding protein [Chloroflexota bacterium]|nr:HU family DNA-binding protein [Chloroflexota bacterium]